MKKTKSQIPTYEESMLDLIDKYNEFQRWLGSNLRIDRKKWVKRFKKLGKEIKN